MNIQSSVAWNPCDVIPTSMSHGNGLQTNAAYDLDHRLTSLQVLDGAVVVQGRTYAYSDGMNLTAITDTVAAANNVALNYNAVNRLQNADGSWGQSTFYYDGVGNRTYDINTVAAVTTTRIAGYPPGTNRISDMTENGAAFRTYTHDAAGNIITEVRPGAETFAYAYNNRNRLASVTRNSVAYATYVYNAFEQLTSRNTAAPAGPVGTVHYIHDTDGHLIAEADASTGATTREYLWLPSNDNQNDTMAESMGLAANDNAAVDLPLAVVNVSATPVIYQVHTDHLGRPIRMTDAVKATVWQATYKPFGEVQAISGTATQNLRFPGQYFQIETGLAYNHHRSYDPITGRYTQADPLRFVDGPSVYAYVGSSPFMNVDREGLAVFVNNSDWPIWIKGTQGRGHGHPDPNPKDDTYVSVLVPPGGRIDACNPGMGPNGEKIYDVDAIDFNRDGKVAASPYDPRDPWDWPGAAWYYHGPGAEQVKGGDTAPIITAKKPRPMGRSGGGKTLFDWQTRFPIDARCGCK
jgi:RHS repeat-associated protein